MRQYIIFTDCMIGRFKIFCSIEDFVDGVQFSDAWLSHGVTDESLRIAIVKVIARLNHKVRSRGYRRKPAKVAQQADSEGEEEVYEGE